MATTIIKTILISVAGMCVLLLNPVQIHTQDSDGATVFLVDGDVRIIRLGSNVGVKCEIGMIVRAGDWVRTGANSSATLAFDHNAENVVKLQEKSLLVMKMDGYFQIQLLEGKINAILEGMRHGETFRVLTPSVVTESANSTWAISAEGSYSTVVVIDGEAFLCGINPDGSIKKTRFAVPEGYSRTTVMYEDPDELVATPESVLQWFRDQVIEHHLDRVIAAQRASGEWVQKFEDGEDLPEAPRRVEERSQQPPEIPHRTPRDTADAPMRSGSGKNVAIIDGEEVDLIEYITRGRMRDE